MYVMAEPMVTLVREGQKLVVYPSSTLTESGISRLTRVVPLRELTPIRVTVGDIVRLVMCGQPLKA
jgi:hypothetical protein